MVYSMVSEEIKAVRDKTDAANREYVLWLLGGSVGPPDEELRKIADRARATEGETR